MKSVSKSKKTFWQLLEEYKVQIPIIQRDYAQGRKNDEKTKNVRNLFLDALTEAIKDENKAIKLDFVYGDLNDGVFQPLDGQQRLTTLFLLHWYVAFSAGKLSDVKETLSKFTYETRASSREFCEALVKKELPNDAVGDNIREQIKDASWFFLSWNNDPTIKGMLVMLKAIEEKLGESMDGALWEKLTSEDNPPISFYFTELGKFGLTDDLYIKMNARGKQLTDFENFKARFEKHIEEGGFEESVGYEDKFSTKIDGEWLDLFWQYKAEDNPVDKEFMKFMAGVARNYYATHSVEKDRIKLLFDNPNDLEPTDFSTDEAFTYLKNCFNVYAKKKEGNFCNIEKDKNLNLFFNRIKKDETLFEYGIKNKAGYNQQFLYYAQTSFLLQVNDENEFNQEHFDDWMRVHRNIAMNCSQRSIDSVDDYMSAVKLSNELLEGRNNIYAFLADDKNTIKSNFAGNQVAEEERIKAGLIIKDKTNWRQEIVKIDDHDYFAGQIRFILKYANNEAGYDIDKFKSYADKLAILFGNDFGHDNQNLFRRALLTKGDYLLPNSGRGKRSNKLLFLFGISIEDKYNNWRRVFNDDEKTKVLQGLLDDLNERKDSSKLVEELKSFITDYQKDDWRKAIIEYPWIFERKRKSILEENGRIYVLNGTTTRSWHFEVFTHYLYVKLCEHNINKEGTEVKRDFYWGTGAEHLNKATGKRPHIPIENKIQNKHYKIYHKGNQIFQIYDGDRKCIEEIEGVQQTIAKLKAIFSNETPQT